MNGDASEQYRVLPRRDDGQTVVLLDRADYQPRVVETHGYDDELTPTVDGIRPGYGIEASLSWQSGEYARFDAVTVRDPTLFTFARGVSGLFEVALDTWSEAQRQGLGINSRVTYSNDGQPNGALYTFAAQPGAPDIFEEFRSGRRPLDPLLDRVEEPPPYEVFVFDPATHEFVLVYIVLSKRSILADTVRDTYDCPRSAEPLVAEDRAAPSDQTDLTAGRDDDASVDLWSLTDDEPHRSGD